MQGAEIVLERGKIDWPNRNTKVEQAQVASPKGLVAGLRSSGSNQQPETMPTSIENISLSHLGWILVVEKEVGHVW